MSGSFTESIVEQAALARLETAGWQIRSGCAMRSRASTRRCPLMRWKLTVCWRW